PADPADVGTGAGGLGAITLDGAVLGRLHAVLRSASSDADQRYPWLLGHGPAGAQLGVRQQCVLRGSCIWTNPSRPKHQPEEVRRGRDRWAGRRRDCRAAAWRGPWSRSAAYG